MSRLWYCKLRAEKHGQCPWHPALFQFDVGQRIHLGELAPLFIVALQAVGGAAGNMICVHNVVAASATVGLHGREGALIRKTLIPTAYYLAAAGVIGCTVLLLF